MNYRESLITAETSYSPTKPYLPTYLLTYIHTQDALLFSCALYDEAERR